MPYKSYLLAVLCGKSLLLVAILQGSTNEKNVNEKLNKSPNQQKITADPHLFNPSAYQRVLESPDRFEIQSQYVIKYSGDPVDDLQQILGSSARQLKNSHAIIPRTTWAPIIVPSPSLETTSGESNLNFLDDLVTEPAVISSLSFEQVLDEQSLVNRSTDQIKLNSNALSNDPTGFIETVKEPLVMACIPKPSKYGYLNVDLDNQLAKFSDQELKEIQKCIFDNVFATKNPEVFNFLSYDLADLGKEELQEIMRRVDCHVYLRKEVQPNSKKKKSKKRKS